MTKLRAVRSRLLKTRGWLPAQEVTGVCSTLGIGAVADPEDALGLALVGTSLRLHGTRWLLHTGAATARTKAASQKVQKWMRIGQVRKGQQLWKYCVSALHGNDSAHVNKAVLRSIKEHLKDRRNHCAMTYLIGRSASRHWCPSNGQA